MRLLLLFPLSQQTLFVHQQTDPWKNEKKGSKCNKKNTNGKGERRKTGDVKSSNRPPCGDYACSFT
jgi:hypothetical protein